MIAKFVINIIFLLCVEILSLSVAFFLDIYFKTKNSKTTKCIFPFVSIQTKGARKTITFASLLWQIMNFLIFFSYCGLTIAEVILHINDFLFTASFYLIVIYGSIALIGFVCASIGVILIKTSKTKELHKKYLEQEKTKQKKLIAKALLDAPEQSINGCSLMEIVNYNRRYLLEMLDDGQICKTNPLDTLLQAEYILTKKGENDFSQ